MEFVCVDVMFVGVEVVLVGVKVVSVGVESMLYGIVKVAGVVRYGSISEVTWVCEVVDRGDISDDTGMKGIMVHIVVVVSLREVYLNEMLARYY